MRVPLSFRALTAALAVVSAAANPFALNHVVDDPNPTTSDRFGRDVAIGNTYFVVGNRFDDTNGLDIGQAHVFDIVSGGLIATLDDPMPTTDDHFGFALAIDGNRVLVGEKNHDVASMPNAGLAHLFDAATGALLQTFADPNPAAGDQFGHAVDLAGNLALVSLRFDQTDGFEVGLAQLFNANTGALLFTLHDPTPTLGSDGDQFGFAVAVEAPYAAVAAPSAQNFTQGEVHVFDTSTGALLHTIFDPSPAFLDNFGNAISLDQGKLLVGERNSDFAGSNVGQAHLFDVATGALLQTFNNPSPNPEDLFGQDAAINGNNVLIGARNDDTDGSNVGRAFLFDAISGALLHTFSDPTPTGSDNFGLNLGITGEFVIVGARGDDTLGTDIGQAYVFGPSLQANAGPDQSVDENDAVQLDGSGSIGAATYSWSQLAGTVVTLSSTTAPQPGFTAPYVPLDTTLTFELEIDDGSGTTDTDVVDITIVTVNDPPVADAGDDGTIKEGAVASLDGSNSYDPEGDSPLFFQWTQISGPAVVLSPSDTDATPTFVAPLGAGNTLQFDLVVSDGKEESAADSVAVEVVENSPPVADAGSPQSVLEGSLVVLDASLSSDPDGGDTLSFDWTEPVTLDNPGSVMPTFTAPSVAPGGTSLTFSLAVTDDDPVNPLSDTDAVVITVLNVNDPPDCSLARAVCPDSKIGGATCVMWPPNHKMLAVELEGISDPDEDPITIVVTGITQDEPTDGLGDGDTAPDATVTGTGVLIRSERAGGGNGRVYELSFSADDGQGGSCNGSVGVSVPHNRKATAVDDGQAYDSTL